MKLAVRPRRYRAPRNYMSNALMHALIYKYRRFIILLVEWRDFVLIVRALVHNLLVHRTEAMKSDVLGNGLRKYEICIKTLCSIRAE